MPSETPCEPVFQLSDKVLVELSILSTTTWRFKQFVGLKKSNKFVKPFFNVTAVINALNVEIIIGILISLI